MRACSSAGGLPRKPRHELACLPFGGELPGVGVGRRRDAELGLADQFRGDARGPNATSGPRAGSWTMPARARRCPRASVRPGPGDRSAQRPREPRPRSRTKRDPAGLGLVRAGLRALDDRRKAQLGWQLPTPPPMTRRPARARQGFRRPEAARGPGRAEARDPRRPPRPPPRRSDLGRVDAVERRNEPGGTAEPFGSGGSEAQSPGSRLRVREDGQAGHQRQVALGDQRTPERLASYGRPSRETAAATSSAPATTGETKRPMTASKPGSPARSGARPRRSRPSPSQACRPGSRRWPRSAGPLRSASRSP